METVLASPCADTNARIGKGMATPLSLSDNQVDIMRLVAEGTPMPKLAGASPDRAGSGQGRVTTRQATRSRAGADGNVRVLITQAYFQYSGQAHPR